MQPPVNPWLTQKVFIALPIVEKDWQNDQDLKAAFGIELAKDHANAFIAACVVFPKETQKALYASTQWLNDPIVIEAKENYNEAVKPEEKILDKDQLSLKLLAFSEDKIDYNGNLVYSAQAKDRLKALELYAKIRGFINDKAEINNTINNSNRFMEIKFVEPEKKENVKTIEHSPIQEENILENSPIELKLVG